MVKAKKDAPETIRAKVLWPNVWTSRGKRFKGDVIELSPEDFAALDAVDAVKRV